MTPHGWQIARVVETRQQTASARAIRLEVDSWSGSEAGQHIDLRLTAEDGYQAVRSYSLASFGTSSTIELAIDEIPTGEVSPYLVRDVIVGDEVEVKGPLGRFFIWNAEHPGPVQLIAGGSGVVPLMSMMRSATASGRTSSMRMMYSVRTPEDAMYRDEVTEIAEAGLDVRWVYSRAAPKNWGGSVGRVNEVTLRDAVWGAVRDPLIFVCGPTGFVEHVADLLVRLGHAPEQIRTERFGGS